MKISNSIAQIELYQEYVNRYTESIETEYFFAIPPTAAFVALEAKINGKLLKGRVKEKEQAKQEYRDAVDAGRSAAYAEVVAELHDIMKLNVGNLKPQEEAVIKFVYLETLEVFLNKFWRLNIGNTFSSRSVDAQAVSPDLAKVCAASSITVENKEESYAWTVEVEIQSPSQITFLESPSHPVKVRFSKDRLQAFVSLDSAAERNNKK